MVECGPRNPDNTVINSWSSKWAWTLPPHFPEDCIVSLFFVAGVDISSSASWRNPSLNALPWGFPQELAAQRDRPITTEPQNITTGTARKHTEQLMQDLLSFHLCHYCSTSLPHHCSLCFKSHSGAWCGFSSHERDVCHWIATKFLF